jgi:hypothetical protein
MSKISRLFCLTLIFITFLSCQNSKKKEITKKIYWNEIELITKNQRILINCFSDTATSEKAIYKKVRGEFINSEYELERVEKKNFSINKKERESLFKNVYKLITKPTFTDKTASDYVGYILIKLKDRNTTLMCEYKSVGEWSTISPETKNIYNLINTKVEITK